MDVSVIIVNWNTSELLLGCLRSIFDQKLAITFEVIVIDNASSDDSIVKVKSMYPKVTIIENNENKGFAAANNQGMKIAKGRYILCLNPDTIVLDRAMQSVVEYADVHTEAAVIGCQVLLNSVEIQKTCFTYPSIKFLIIGMFKLNKIFPQSRFFGGEYYEWWDRRTPKQVDVVSGMFMLVRKAAIDQVGMMDESYFIYAEETDWCYRFNKAGWKCLFTPDAQIIHLHGGSNSTSQVSVKMYVQMQKSILIFIRKHFGGLSWLLSKIVLILFMIIRTLISAMVAAIQHDSDSRQKLLQSLAALRFHVIGAQPK